VPVGGALTIVAIVVAIVVAASGGGGGNDDEDQVAGVIQTSYTTTDPADCRKLYTQRFLEWEFRSSGPDAVKACADDTRFTGDDPNSVDVTDVRVSGDSATSETAVNGGIFDGQPWSSPRAGKMISGRSTVSSTSRTSTCSVSRMPSPRPLRTSATR